MLLMHDVVSYVISKIVINILTFHLGSYDMCCKSFSYSSDLSCNRCMYLGRHRCNHTGEKSYLCDQCDKVFSHSGDLARHLHIHPERIKPYSCDECSIAFSHFSH